MALQSCYPKKPEVRVYKTTAEYHPEWLKHYDSAGYNGSFVLYSPQEGIWHQAYHNCSHDAYIPASTFKIPNSLIALECGSIKDENEVLKWDGVKRWNAEWNKDTDMKLAMKNSTVWFYQELARRTGEKKMQHYLDLMNYGNADISGGIDRFWLNGGIRISPAGQIGFLENLYYDRLPFKKENQQKVKNILVQEKIGDATLKAKRGWGSTEDGDIGWYVGYVEKKDKVYFFSNCVFKKDTNDAKFIGARKEITKKILKEFGILE